MSEIPSEHAGGPLVLGAAVYIEHGPFLSALKACLAAALQGRDAPTGGAKFKMHPSAFRMALEVREALKRACGVEIAVQDWDHLLREVRVLPGDLAHKAE